MTLVLFKVNRLFIKRISRCNSHTLAHTHTHTDKLTQNHSSGWSASGVAQNSIKQNGASLSLVSVRVQTCLLYLAYFMILTLIYHSVTAEEKRKERNKTQRSLVQFRLHPQRLFDVTESVCIWCFCSYLCS